MGSGDTAQVGSQSYLLARADRRHAPWVARCCPATRQARRWDTPKRACRCTTALRRRFGVRSYFSGSDANCAKLGTIAATVIAGPLNYLGVDPKVNCHVPQPSK
jgi:hypothetical protein